VTTLSLLLPTRGRPALVERFLDSVWQQAADPARVEVVMYMDDDDTASHGISHPRLDLVKIIGPRLPMGALNSACLARSKGEIIILCNDDIVVRTSGWDDKIRALHGSMPDGIYLAYPNDLFKGRRLCAFPILARKTCELLGEPFPRAYQGAFIDYHLLDIFKRLESHLPRTRIIYMEDVVFEHMHFRSGKGKLDATYTARRRFGDDDVFLRLRDMRSAAAAGLLRAIDPARQYRDPVSVAAAASTQPGLIRATLLDRELPWRWAVRLYSWFLARSVACRISR